MPTGRPPKPAALKVLEGNRGKRPIKAEPRPGPGAPPAPAGLSKEARAEWRRIVPELDRVGLLARVDRPTLVAYVQAWATYWAITREAEGAPATIVQAGTGNVVKNPVLSALSEASRELHRYSTELGLSPVARARLTVKEPEPDELSKLLA